MPFPEWSEDADLASPDIGQLPLSSLHYVLGEVRAVESKSLRNRIAELLRKHNAEATAWSLFGKRNKFCLRCIKDGAAVEFIISVGSNGFTVHDSIGGRYAFYSGDQLAEDIEGLYLKLPTD